MGGIAALPFFASCFMLHELSTLDKGLLIFYTGITTMLSQRQEIILHSLIKEYIDSAEPISSDLLKKRGSLNVSPATIRNELQELTELGYIMQPHTSAGRVPTEKGYKLFIEITFTSPKPQIPKYIEREISQAHEQIAEELVLARELSKRLERAYELLHIETAREDVLLDILKLLGPARQSHTQNIEVMQELLKKFESF